MFIPKNRTCPKCKTTVDAGAPYCPNCGASMQKGRGRRTPGNNVPSPAWLLFMLIGIPAGAMGACSITAMSQAAESADPGLAYGLYSPGLLAIPVFLFLLWKMLASFFDKD